MKTLILFNLKRKYVNKLTIIVNIVLLMVIYVFFHIDSFIDNTPTLISLDRSVGEYIAPLLSKEESEILYCFQEDKTEQVVLSFKDKWIISSINKLDEQTIDLVKADLLSLIRDSYYSDNKDYIDLVESFEIENIYLQENREVSLIAIASIVYVCILSFSSLISNEVIYEKSSHVIDIVLTNVDSKTHLLSKIYTGILVPLIQVLLTLFYIFINFIIRYYQDHLIGLINLLKNYLDIDQNIKVFSTSELLFIAVNIFVCLISVQVIVLLIVSRFKNPDEANAVQSLLYVCMLAIYYFSLMVDSNALLQNEIMKTISFLPLISMFLMSCRIILDDVSKLEIIVSIILNILFLFTLIEYSIPLYKKNITN